MFAGTTAESGSGCAVPDPLREATGAVGCRVRSPCPAPPAHGDAPVCCYGFVTVIVTGPRVAAVRVPAVAAGAGPTTGIATGGTFTTGGLGIATGGTFTTGGLGTATGGTFTTGGLGTATGGTFTTGGAATATGGTFTTRRVGTASPTDASGGGITAAVLSCPPAGAIIAATKATGGGVLAGGAGRVLVTGAGGDASVARGGAERVGVNRMSPVSRTRAAAVGASNRRWLAVNVRWRRDVIAANQASRTVAAAGMNCQGR